MEHCVSRSACIRVRAFVEQEFRELGMAAVGGDHQCTVTIGTSIVDIGTTLEQRLCAFDTAVPRSKHQRGVPTCFDPRAHPDGCPGNFLGIAAAFGPSLD